MKTHRDRRKIRRGGLGKLRHLSFSKLKNKPKIFIYKYPILSLSSYNNHFQYGCLSLSSSKSLSSDKVVLDFLLKTL
jgi:hypothetical protein